MATMVIMPKQGQSVESCILYQICKQKGERVAKGEVLFQYETDKASFEEPAPVSGVVLDLFFSEGDEVPVLTPVLVIGQEGEVVEGAPAVAAPAVAAPAATAPEASVPEASVAEVTAKADAEVDTGIDTGIDTGADTGFAPGVAASPRAKALAQKEGIDPGLLLGTGPQGRVIARDVEAAVAQRGPMTALAKEVARETHGRVPERGSGLAGTVRAADIQPQSTAQEFEIKPLSNIRKLIAQAMHASLQQSAQLTHHLGADARRVQSLRKQVKAAVDKGYAHNITLNDMVCWAVIKALKQFPNVNAHFLGTATKYFTPVHLAVAVDTPRGLMVPVVRYANTLSLPQLSDRIKELSQACKKGNVDPDLLSAEAATFTVSNLGNYGVEIFTPVINLPQVAILGVNTIVPRPKELGDGVYGFVPYMGLSLTYDHRAIDGGEATRFVKQIAIELENLEIEL